MIVIPDTQSQEKKDMLRLAGAELVEVPAVPYANPNNYVKVSGRLAERARADRAERRGLGQPVRQRRQPPGAISRRPARRSGTQTDGKVDGFICAVGTGGTLAGVGMALKERNPDVAIGLADPMGAALYSYYTTRRAEGARAPRSPRASARAAITANLEGAPVDRAFQIPDEEAVPIVFDLLEHEGLVPRRLDRASTSPARSGWRSELGPGQTIVTILCDYGTRYQSKLFNPAFLRSKGLPVPAWLTKAGAVGPHLGCSRGAGPPVGKGHSRRHPEPVSQGGVFHDES